MSLDSLISKVLTVYSVDVGDAKAGLKDLQGEQRALQQAEIEAAEARNAQLDDWKEGLTKITVGLAAMGAAAAVVFESWKSYAENLRLETAAGRADIDQLSGAFDGLVSRHEMLQFAAKSLHGAVALNQDQMNTLASATVYFAREGLGSTQEVMEKLEDAAVSLRTRGLKELGVEVQQGATQADTLRNIMDALNTKMREGGPIAETEADRIERMAAGWADLKEKMAEGVVVLTEGTNAMALFNEQLAIHEKYWGAGTVDPGFNYDQIGGTSTPDGDPWAAESNITAAGITRGIVALDKLGKRFGDFEEAHKHALEAAKKAFEERRKLADTVEKSMTDDLVKRLQEDVNKINTAQSDWRTPDQKNLDAGFTIPGLDGGVKLPQSDSTLQLAQKQTLLQKTFGPVGEFDLYKKGFEALTGAVGTAYDAWVSGSESAGAAFKKFIGQSVEATGKQMAWRPSKRAHTHWRTRSSSPSSPPATLRQRQNSRQARSSRVSSLASWALAVRRLRKQAPEAGPARAAARQLVVRQAAATRGHRDRSLSSATNSRRQPRACGSCRHGGWSSVRWALMATRRADGGRVSRSFARRRAATRWRTARFVRRRHAAYRRTEAEGQLAALSAARVLSLRRSRAAVHR